MNIKKLAGLLVIVFVLFWIISAPTSASGTVDGLLGNLKEAGDSLVQFTSDVAGSGSGSGSNYDRH